MQPQFIHHLVAFPAKYIEAFEKYREYQDKRSEELRQAFNDDKELKHAWDMGGRHRGSFTDKEQLISIIKKQNDPYSICECYYEYLLIETHQLNVIDGCLFEPDYTNETWFRFIKIDEDTWEYQEIERPECLKGTFNFV
jgi:hypothetical protein